MAPLAVGSANRGSSLNLVFCGIFAGVNSGVEQGVDEGRFSGTAAAQERGGTPGDKLRNRGGVVAVVRADGEHRIHAATQGFLIPGELFRRHQITLGENQRDLHPGSVRQSGVAFDSPDGRLGEARLNDAEHIHVGGDRLIRGFAGGAGAGEVASAGQNREGLMLRGLAIATGPGDGLSQHPVAHDGVLFFAVVIFDRTQGSGELHELAPLTSQQFAAGAVHGADAGESEILEGTVEGERGADCRTLPGWVEAEGL